MAIIGPNSLSNGGGHLLRYQKSNQQVAQSLERLSTGKRINRPSDDPSGYIAAEGLRGDLVVLSAESRGAESQRLNGRQRQSALSQIQNVLNNVRGSLVTAADGTNSPAQSQAIQLEIDASLDAIDRIADGVDGVAGSAALSALRSGGDASVSDGDIAAAAELVDAKLSDVSSANAAIGTYERTHIDTFQRIREDQIVITAETLSQIEDTDYAAEASKFVQGKIISEASLAALAFSRREQIELMDILLEGLDETSG